MNSRELFIDTSGFFSVLLRQDPAHAEAVEYLRKWQESGKYVFTTDYVVDETATLLKVRGAGHVLFRFFQVLDSSKALSLVFVDEDRFRKSRDFLLKHVDHGYSFTDCTSFVLMKERGATDALTKDKHFQEAGFTPLLS
jgi:predicted nucleic acid-binding protein